MIRTVNWEKAFLGGNDNFTDGIMYVVPEEDIVTFARGLIGRHGRRARECAEDAARSLAAVGDREGAAAWIRVADEVARRSKQQRMSA